MKIDNSLRKLSTNKRGRPFKSFKYKNDLNEPISIKEFRHIETIKRKIDKLGKENLNSIIKYLIQLKGGNIIWK